MHRTARGGMCFRQGTGQLWRCGINAALARPLQKHAGECLVEGPGWRWRESSLGDDASRD